MKKELKTGCFLVNGSMGVKVDASKGLKLLQRAVELDPWAHYDRS